MNLWCTSFSCLGFQPYQPHTLYMHNRLDSFNDNFLCTSIVKMHLFPNCILDASSSSVNQPNVTSSTASHHPLQPSTSTLFSNLISVTYAFKYHTSSFFDSVSISDTLSSTTIISLSMVVTSTTTSSLSHTSA